CFFPTAERSSSSKVGGQRLAGRRGVSRRTLLTVVQVGSRSHGQSVWAEASWSRWLQLCRGRKRMAVASRLLCAHPHTRAAHYFTCRLNTPSIRFEFSFVMNSVGRSAVSGTPMQSVSLSPSKE